MTGPKLPNTSRTCENKASPCSTCENSDAEGPKDPQRCQNCAIFDDWEKRETKPWKTE